MAFVDPGQYQLTPNVGAALQGGLQSAQMIQQMQQTSQDRQLRQAAMKQREEAQGISQRILSGLNPNDPEIAQLAATDPQIFEQTFKQLGMIDQNRRNEAANFAFDLQNTPPDQRQAKINARIQDLTAQGRDPRDTAQLSGLPADQQDQILKFIQIASLPADKRLELTTPAPPAQPQIREGVDPTTGAPGVFAVTPEGATQIPGISPDVRSLDLRKKELELARATEKRQSEKLSAGLEKALLDTQDATVKAQQAANEYTVLADDFSRLKASGGLAATTSETFKKILGTQDDVTEFRRRFNQVRLSEGLRNLPPGPATDRDVQEAFRGVPPENAPPEQVVSFLKGAARLARLEAGYNQFKADYISEKSSAKGLNNAWRSSIMSPRLNRKVSTAEIYETAQNRGVTPEEVRSMLGIE